MLDLLHPITVHFPIALIIVSFLFAIVFIIRKRDLQMNTCVKLLVVLAAAGTWAAVVTGFYHIPLTPEAYRIAEIHHQFAILTSWSITVTAIIYLLSFFPKIKIYKWIYIVAFASLTISAVLIAFTGYYGGYIVYNVLL